MPKPKELRKIIKILSKYGVEFSYSKKGKHSGKFYKGPLSFPVKAHGKKTEILPYALNGLIRKFDLPEDVFD